MKNMNNVSKNVDDGECIVIELFLIEKVKKVS